MLKQKSDVDALLKEWKAVVEYESKGKLGKFKIENEGEFCNIA